MTRKLLKAALLASGAALLIAAGPKADLNQDGQVTKAEFTESAQARFTAIDVNNDGLLSEDERKAHKTAKREAWKEKRFTKKDTNGDGVLSRDEVNAADAKKSERKGAHRQKMMEKYDTNLDGTLSEAERTVMKAERKEKWTEMKAKRKGQQAQRPKPDANGDGFVSLDEHMAVAEQLFTHLDANADGVLTEGEGRKRRGKRGKKRGG